jgi:CubicO group peptidase (beta-lactamase class C family)
LLTQVCKPLGLEKTTFFPKEFSDAVAVPGTTTTDAIAMALNPKQHPQRLGERHRMTHTGAGLYSTAEELGIFARMMLNKGNCGSKEFLSERSWKEMTKPPFPGEAYGLGWRLQVKDGKVASIFHSGDLVGYRSRLYIDLENRTYKVALFTLPSLSAEVPNKVNLAFLNRRIMGVVYSRDPAGEGVLVERVLDETPAATAGIKVGDRVLKVADTKVTNVSQAIAAVRDGDEEITIIVLRGEQEVELSVRFEQ